MSELYKLDPKGNVTSPKSFIAGGTYAGLKTLAESKLDLGLLRSEVKCSSAGVFTKNKIRSHSVTLSEKNLKKGPIQGIVVNSGIANACVGDQGMIDAEECVNVAATHMKLLPDELVICSTGIIGVELPVDLIRKGITEIDLSNDGGDRLAEAILTTDTKTKQASITFELDNKKVTIGGIAKGAGMIHPNMATMLAFITTDAAISEKDITSCLRKAVDVSFNMISVDGDTSTNDSVIMLANGTSKVKDIDFTTSNGNSFQQALNQLCIYLAKEIVGDAEGAQKCIEVKIEGCSSAEDARSIARTIISSTLVKTAIHGSDPNWGRILAAVGRSGISIDENKITLNINGVCMFENGIPVPFHKEGAIGAMNKQDVNIHIKFNNGKFTATAWGSDLSEEYVTFNSMYTT